MFCQGYGDINIDKKRFVYSLKHDIFTVLENDKMGICWQRYYLFDILEANEVEYDQVLMVDADTIVHPECPNFFEMTEKGFYYSSIGRKLINLYFNNKLSDDLKSKYEKKYETDIAKINANVYSGSRANVYLAKFFPFVSDNKKDPQMQKLILDCLDEFFDLHISCFENYENHKINFICILVSKY